MEQDCAWKKKEKKKKRYFGVKNSIILNKIPNFCDTVLELIRFSKF